jgi:hypothetical protein
MMEPPSMTATREASWSASSRYWVVRKIVVPCSASPRAMSHMTARPRGSTPVVGSSRTTMAGLSISDMARSRRRPMPPEYVAVGFLATSVRLNCSSSSAVRALARLVSRWASLAIMRRFSSPVSSPSTAAN